jgi:hypothetical protein
MAGPALANLRITVCGRARVAEAVPASQNQRPGKVWFYRQESDRLRRTAAGGDAREVGVPRTG